MNKKLLIGLAVLVITGLRCTETIITDKTPAQLSYKDAAAGTLNTAYGLSGVDANGDPGDTARTVRQFSNGSGWIVATDGVNGPILEKHTDHTGIVTAWGSESPTDGTYTSVVTDQALDTVNGITELSGGRVLVLYKDNDAGWRIEVLTAGGKLDTTWSSDGIYIYGANGDEPIAIQNLGNDRVMVYGNTSNGWTVLMFTATGELDTTWNGTGIYVSDVANSTDDEISRIIALADGRFLLCGKDNSKGWHTELLTAAGVLDATWGAAGVHTFADPAYGVEMAMQLADGRIVLAGNSLTGWRVEMVTLTDGVLDVTWGGGDGIYKSDDADQKEDTITNIIQLASGSILIIGNDADAGWRMEALTLSGGVLDTNWGGGDGIHTYGVATDEIADVIQLGDNRLIVAGNDADAGWRAHMLTTSGALDASWATGGVYTSDVANAAGDTLQEVVLAVDGSLILLGSDASAGWRIEFLYSGINPLKSNHPLSIAPGMVASVATSEFKW